MGIIGMKKIALFLLVISFQVNAATVIGGGANSCAYMLQTLQSNNQYHVVWRQWITGFISGSNHQNGLRKGSSIDEDALVYEVKNYCQREPMKNIFDAVIWLYDTKLQ